MLEYIIEEIIILYVIYESQVVPTSHQLFTVTTVWTLYASSLTPEAAAGSPQTLTKVVIFINYSSPLLGEMRQSL